MKRYQGGLLVDNHARLGEGPCWDERANRLYWLDILGKTLFCCDALGGDVKEYPLPFLTGTLALTQGQALLLAGEKGLHFYRPENGLLSFVANPEADEPGHRFNDGKCGPDGRFWVGGVRQLGADAAPPCALYKMEANLRVEKVLAPVDVSNGLAWSPDAKTMYYIDSPRQEVWAFDYDVRAGNLQNRRTVVKIDPAEGEPDGMTIDRDGMLWVAIWNGGCVAQFDPSTGERLAQVDIDAPLSACPTFGGEDFGTLFITSASSASFGKPLQTGHEGSLFALKTGAIGRPAFRFPITEEQLTQRHWEETR